MSVQKSKKPIGSLIIAIVLGLVSVGVIAIYSQTMNVAIGLCSLPLIGGTLYFYTRWQNVDYKSVKFVKDTIDIKKGEANSFCIYARKTGKGNIVPVKVAFENVTKPDGMLRRFPQLGNIWIPVMIYNVDSRTLEPFDLPDAEYCDPRVLAEAVNMKSNKQYYKGEVTLFQQLRPWIMIAACTVAGIILIALPVT